jgi:RNA polymerase sigma-70 factor (ECF subfamily)
MATPVSISGERANAPSREVTDLEALQRLGEGVRRGDPQALEAVVDQFGPGLRNYLHTCVGHREVAEDLLQDTLLAAVRHCRRLRHPERLRSWLFRIARHTALNWQRRRRRHPDLGAPAPEDLPPRPSEIDRADERAVRQDLRRVLDQALATLPGAEREVIVLRHFEHMSSAEVARVVGVRVGTVHSRTHRGLRRLLRHLRSEGIGLEDLL